MDNKLSPEVTARGNAFCHADPMPDTIGGHSTHRTRSISLAVFTTAKGSRRLQSQKWISLAVAISRS